eukprot:461994-Hanusia_phi.AAC.2
MTIANMINGSAGGGQESPLLYLDFQGMRRQQDGRFYFMAPGQGRVQACGRMTVLGAGEDQEAASTSDRVQLWDFAYQGYGEYAVANLETR